MILRIVVPSQDNSLLSSFHIFMNSFLNRLCHHEFVLFYNPSSSSSCMISFLAHFLFLPSFYYISYRRYYPRFIISFFTNLELYAPSRYRCSAFFFFCGKEQSRSSFDSHRVKVHFYLLVNCK